MIRAAASLTILFLMGLLAGCGSKDKDSKGGDGGERQNKSQPEGVTGGGSGGSYRLTENYFPHIKGRVRHYDRIEGKQSTNYRLTEKGDGLTLRETPFSEPVTEKRVVRNGFVEQEGARSINRWIKIGADVGDSWSSADNKAKFVYEANTAVENVRCATIKIPRQDGTSVNTAIFAEGIGLVFFYSEVKKGEGKWTKTGEIIYDEWRSMNKKK